MGFCRFNFPSGRTASEDRPPTAGLTRLGRVTRPRRAAGPGPARVLVHWGETWSIKVKLCRCHKGSETTHSMLQNGVLRYPAPLEYRLLPPLRATSPGEGGFGACTSHSLTGKARKASPSPRQPPRQGQKKRPRRSGEAFLRCRRDHSALGAPTGHTPAHAPHSMQVSASMTYLPSPSEIALTGHSAAQAPQAMHSSEILYAMVKYTSLLVCLYCNSFGGKKQGLFLKKNQIRGFFCRSRPHSAEKIFF